MSARPPWPTLLAATRPVVAWGALLVSAGAAVGLAGLTAVLPAVAGAPLPGLAVLVLAAGLGAVADDGTAALTSATPVTARRRLLARAALAVPASAAGLAAVLLVAAAAGAGTGWAPVRLWAVLGALALAAGTLGARAGVPGVVPAILLLGAGSVLQVLLPASVLRAAPWDSAAERAAWGLLLAVVLLAWATRDRAARRPGRPADVSRARGRRPARPPAAASR